MQSRIKLFDVFILAILVNLTSVGLAQEAVKAPEKGISAGDVNEAAVPSFPYVALITNNNVNIRSGPGTNYYSCGKLNKNDSVKIVGSRFTWSQIVPPAGSFSWISKQYVSIDPNDPTIGIVTGEGVRVYVGSNYREPIHSETTHLKLSKGEEVKLLGEEKDDYYKIAPPAGAYRWVSTRYTNPLGPVGEVLEPAAVVAGKISEKLKEYYALKKKIDTERAKPIPQQNYAEIKKALLEIADSNGAGKAARYSEFTIKQIKRFELAFAVEKVVRLGDAQLQQIRERIEKARIMRLAEVPALGRFTAVGEFQTFETYGPGHYRLIDDSGKIICYALPRGSASKMDLSKLVGRKVGLVGTTKPHPPTKGALVRFAEIALLN